MDSRQEAMAQDFEIKALSLSKIRTLKEITFQPDPKTAPDKNRDFRTGRRSESSQVDRQATVMDSNPSSPSSER